ncbi:MAG: hypothetical protein EOM19_04375 [Candidatus Moranbacteria bacterium]|nr:hypothetical protein [Candidatus Moranbacteria bacterium]
MKESGLIIAPHLSDEEKEVFYKQRDLKREKGLRGNSWEIPPDQEVKTFEPLLWKMIAQEETLSGISPQEKGLERIHFLQKKKYEKIFGESWGVYAKERDAIFMPEKFTYRGNLSPERERALRLRTLLHENIHSLSYEEDMVSKHTGKLYARRSGYLFSSLDGKITKFRGLNEAINEKICFELFKDNQEELCKLFSDSEKKDWIFHSYSYPFEGSVLEYILFEVAKKTKKSQEETWDELRKGLFTGEMRHLKKIDRVFGPGSLRFLSVMGSIEEDGVNANFFGKAGDDDFWKMRNNQCFRSYFSNSGKTFEQRFSLVKDILSDKEKERFKRENGYE